MAKPKSAPAYPRPASQDEFAQDGMTLRQWYAGRAMQGILSSSSNRGGNKRIIAEAAFKMADAMLEYEEGEE